MQSPRGDCGLRCLGSFQAAALARAGAGPADVIILLGSRGAQQSATAVAVRGHPSRRKPCRRPRPRERRLARINSIRRGTGSRRGTPSPALSIQDLLSEAQDHPGW